MDNKTVFNGTLRLSTRNYQSELCTEFTSKSCCGGVNSPPMMIRSGVPSPPSMIGTCAGELPISTTNRDNSSVQASYPGLNALIEVTELVDGGLEPSARAQRVTSHLMQN